MGKPSPISTTVKKKKNLAYCSTKQEEEGREKETLREKLIATPPSISGREGLTNQERIMRSKERG